MTGYRAGKFDRRITIERATMTTNSFNEQVPVWSTLATVWADKQDTSASENYKASEVGAEISTRFVIRFSSTVASVDAKDRILYDNRIYDIKAVREPKGTRDILIEIDAMARAD